MGSKYTEAQKIATMTYLRDSVSDFRVRMPKEKKKELKEKILDTKYEGSINQFIIDAIEEKISRYKTKQ